MLFGSFPICILLHLLRQLRRVRDNVRDKLAEALGVLRGNDRLAGFSFQRSSCHTRDIAAALFPLVRQLVANADGKQPLMYPFLGIALFQIGFQRTVDRPLGVDGLLNALPADQRQPRLERFGFLEGMDWMMRRSCSVSATSVRRFLPSAARIFNW